MCFNEDSENSVPPDHDYPQKTKQKKFKKGRRVATHVQLVVETFVPTSLYTHIQESCFGRAQCNKPGTDAALGAIYFEAVSLFCLSCCVHRESLTRYPEGMLSIR